MSAFADGLRGQGSAEPLAHRPRGFNGHQMRAARQELGGETPGAGSDLHHAIDVWEPFEHRRMNALGGDQPLVEVGFSR